MRFRKSIRHYYHGIFVVDLSAWIFAFLSAYWVRHPVQFPEIDVNYLSTLPYVIIILMVVYRYFGLYNVYRGRLSERIELIFLLKAVTTGMTIILALSFFYRGYSYSRISTVSFCFFTFFFNVISREVYHVLFRKILKTIRWQRKALIIGGGEIGQQLIQEFLNNTTEYHVTGFLDDDTRLESACIFGVPWLGTVQELKRVIPEHDIGEVIIAVSSASKEFYNELINTCQEMDIKYRFVPKLFNLNLQEISVDVLGNVPLIGLRGDNFTGYSYLIKRAVDTVFAFILLIVLAPLMVVIALFIKIISPGPVFYTQERIGYNKKSFKLYKFRSMKVNCDERIHQEYVEKWINNSKECRLNDGEATVYKLTNDPRIIPYVGKFIRKFSIDELPQLFNVLKGEMSLVGPRPCLKYEMTQYKPWHKARFDALPGITGMWQISGRNRLTFDEMIQLDIRYLQNWSFKKDFLIMIKTPLAIFTHNAY